MKLQLCFFTLICNKLFFNPPTFPWQGTLKICQLPSLLCYDNYWPVQKVGHLLLIYPFVIWTCIIVNFNQFFPHRFSYFSNFFYCQIPLKGTPHQVTYFAEKNLYPLIVSVPVSISSTSSPLLVKEQILRSLLFIIIVFIFFVFDNVVSLVN